MCEALANLKVRDEDGTVREIRSGEVFTPADPGAMGPLVKRGLVRVIGEGPGREATMEAVMDTILEAERDEVIRGGIWRPTAATREAEAQIDNIYKDAIKGRAKIIDFKAACERWRRSGQRDDPAMPDK